MSFTNLKYDTPAYEQDLRESIGSLKYNINTPQQCSECFLDDSNMIIQRAGASVDAKESMIDIDSELLGITRKASRDPSKKYLHLDDILLIVNKELILKSSLKSSSEISSPCSHAESRSIISFRKESRRSERSPEKALFVNSAARTDFDEISCATDSACTRSSLPFKNARLVNSPGSARRRSKNRKADKIERTTTGLP